MGFNPSSRRKYEVDEPELNLNPMMDLFGVLIPALLMMSASVEVAVANVAAPSINPDSSNQPQTPPDHPPVNLTVVISDNGYTVSVMGQPIGGGTGPNIPIIQKPTLCSRYRETWPPPRSKNRDRPACAKNEGRIAKPFWVYDNQTLTTKLMDIKSEFPDERRIIIQPSTEVEYETIVDLMDAARDVRLKDGSLQALFDEVVMSPAPT